MDKITQDRFLFRVLLLRANIAQLNLNCITFLGVTMPKDSIAQLVFPLDEYRRHQ